MQSSKLWTSSSSWLSRCFDANDCSCPVEPVLLRFFSQLRDIPWAYLRISFRGVITLLLSRQSNGIRWCYHGRVQRFIQHIRQHHSEHHSHQAYIGLSSVIVVFVIIFADKSVPNTNLLAKFSTCKIECAHYWLAIHSWYSFSTDQPVLMTHSRHTR